MTSPAPLRLGVLASHPIQYFAPLYRALAATPGVDVEVLFGHRPTPAQQGVGFGVAFAWDVDLTSGFPHRFLQNRAARPDLQSFGGIDTPEIAGIIERGRFDAFLVSGWNTRSYQQAMRACWRTRTPVMVRGDSQLVGPSDPLKRMVKRVTYPRFMKRFSACLAVGRRSAEYFRHYGARRVVSSPHFVDNDAFAARAAAVRAARLEVRRAWGIADDAFVPLFAAKFIEKKHPGDFVRAVARAGDGVHGLMVGEGELRVRTEAEARELGARVAFAGFLNQGEIARAFVAADVLVLTSDWRETWGLVVNEAMATGLPALVSEEAGCTPDLVVPGETGFSFARGDVAALTGQLATLARDRNAARRMGEQAMRHVRRYSVEAAAAGVIEGARGGTPRAFAEGQVAPILPT